MNMQYSPRTESIVAVGAYADGMRWVSREREVPVFDRLAIMRHWYDAGQFDLYKATKDLKMAKSVHDCLGRALAATIIDAAHLEAQRRRGAAMTAVPHFFRLATALAFAAAAATAALAPARAETAAAGALACIAPADLDPPDQSAQARGAADRRRPAAHDRRHRLVVDRRRRRKLAGDELSEPA